MKKFLIRINCVSFEDIEVEAETEKEAIKLAHREFVCPQQGSEFGEVIEEEEIEEEKEDAVEEP